MTDVRYSDGGRSPQRDEPQNPLFGLSQRLPPANIQAEQALLGAVLANNKAMQSVIAFLKPQHFADPINGMIYRECARLILRGRLVDAVTLKGIFEDNGTLEEVGGADYLVRLLSAMIGVAHAQDYGRAIYDAWLRRQLIEFGESVIQNAFGAAMDLDGEDQVKAAADHLMEISSSSTKEAPEVQIGDAARQAIMEAEKIARGEVSGRLATGLVPLDDAIGGLWPGYLYLLGGRSGMGKTSLCIQIGVAAAQALKREADDAPPFFNAGGCVLFFSLEMPPEQVGGWAICHLSKLDNEVLKGRPMTGAEAEAALHGQRELDALPFKVVNGSGLSGPAIALRARAINQKQRVRLVIIDHVQKVVSAMDTGRDGQTAGTAKTTSALKDLAGQIGCPVIALVQLGREVDKREDPRPRISDILYSGEADADVIALLYRAERYLPKRPPEKFPKETDEQYSKRRDAWRKRWDEARGRAEVIIAKQRQGAETSIDLGFAGKTTTFYPLGSDEVPEMLPDLWEHG